MALAKELQGLNPNFNVEAKAPGKPTLALSTRKIEGRWEFSRLRNGLSIFTPSKATSPFVLELSHSRSPKLCLTVRRAVGKSLSLKAEAPEFHVESMNLSDVNVKSSQGDITISRSKDISILGFCKFDSARFIRLMGGTKVTIGLLQFVSGEEVIIDGLIQVNGEVIVSGPGNLRLGTDGRIYFHCQTGKLSINASLINFGSITGLNQLQVSINHMLTDSNGRDTIQKTFKAAASLRNVKSSKSESPYNKLDLAITEGKPQSVVQAIECGAVVDYRSMLSARAIRTKSMKDEKRLDAQVISEIVRWKEREHGYIEAFDLQIDASGSVDDASQLRGLKKLQLNVAGSVSLPRQWQWLSGHVHGKIKEILLLKGKVSWLQAGTSEYSLEIGELTIEDTADLSYAEGGNIIVQKRFLNRGTKIFWRNALRLSTTHFIQEKTASINCDRGTFLFETRGDILADEMRGLINLKELCWWIQGATECETQITIALIAKLMLGHKGQLIFKASLIVAGPLIAENSCKCSCLGVSSITIETGVGLLCMLAAPTVRLCLKTDSLLNLESDATGDTQLLAHDLMTEQNSCQQFSGSTVDIRIVKSWDHHGELLLTGPAKVMSVSFGESFNMWPKAHLAMAIKTLVYSEKGEMLLKTGAKLHCEYHFEIVANRVCLQSESEITGEAGSTLIVKSNNYHNSGSVYAANVYLIGSKNFLNDGLINANKSLVVGAAKHFANSGLIKTANCPLKIVTADFSNGTGRLESVNDSIEIELHSPQNVLVDGALSTQQCLVVIARQAERLIFQPDFSINIHPKVIVLMVAEQTDLSIEASMDLPKTALRIITGRALSFNRDFAAASMEICLPSNTRDGVVTISLSSNVTIKSLTLTSANPELRVVFTGNGTLNVGQLTISTNIKDIHIGTAKCFIGNVVTNDNEPLSVNILPQTAVTVAQTLTSKSMNLQIHGLLELIDGSNVQVDQLQVFQSGKILIRETDPDDTEGKPVVEITSKEESVASSLKRFAASNFFGDAFANEFILAPKANGEPKKVDRKPSVTLMGSSLLHSGGFLASSGKAELRLVSKEKVVINGSVQCQANLIILAKALNVESPGKINAESCRVFANVSLDLAIGSTIICREDINLQSQIEACPDPDEKDLSKLDRFAKDLRQSFTTLPTIFIRGSILCKRLNVQAKGVFIGCSYNIRAFDTLSINAWCFANMLSQFNSRNIVIKTQIIGINLGVIFATNSFSLTGLAFVNLGAIHGPMMSFSTIASLLLIGATFSFSRTFNSIVKIELLNAALPTYPTKDLLFSPRHLINAAITTLQQAFPPAKAALMIVQAGFSGLSAFQAFFTIIYKIHNMKKAIDQSNSPLSALQLTDLIELVVQAMGAYTTFTTAVSQIQRVAETTSDANGHLQQLEADEKDFKQLAFDFIKNNFMPTMTETTVYSANEGFRLAHSITDRGLYGYNSGTTIGTGTYMADYRESYENTGKIYAFDDVQISSKVIQMSGKTVAGRDASLKGDTICVKGIKTYKDFKAQAVNDVKVDEAQVGRQMIVKSERGDAVVTNTASETSFIEGRNVTSLNNSAQQKVIITAQEKATVDGVNSKTTVVQAKEAHVSNATGDLLSVDATQARLSGGVKVDKAMVKAVDASLNSEKAVQIFGELTFDVSGKLENAEAIIQRLDAYSNLKITRMLDLEIPNQDVVLSQRNTFVHGLKISAKSVDIGSDLQVEFGNLFLEGRERVNFSGNLVADQGRVDVHTVDGDLTVNAGKTVQGRDGATLVTENGDIHLQAGSSVQSEKGDIGLKAEKDIFADHAVVRADEGRVIGESGQKIIGIATKIHGEGGVKLNGTQGVEFTAVEELVQGRYSTQKRYDHSEVTAGKGQEYQIVDGNGEVVTRTMGVAIDSSQGAIKLKSSDLKTQGDISLQAAGDIKLESDSYRYISDRSTKRSWFGAVKTTTETIDTHVESGSLVSGGAIFANAGGKFEATSFDIKDKDGHKIYGEKGVVLQAIVATRTTNRHRDILGGLFQSDKQLIDNSQRQLTTLRTSDRKAESLVQSGADMNISGVSILSAGKETFLAKDDLNVSKSNIEATGKVQLAAGGHAIIAGSNITSQEQVAASGRKGLHILGIEEPDGMYTRSTIRGGQGDAYDTKTLKKDGIVVDETRHLGVILESAEGDIEQVASTVAADGDVMISAEQGTYKTDVHSQEKVISESTERGLFSKKNTKVTATQIETANIETGGKLFVRAQNVDSIGGQFNTKDGVSIYAKRKAQFRDALGKIDFSSSDKVLFGALKNHSVKDSQQFSVGTNITASDADSASIIEAGDQILFQGSSLATPGLGILSAKNVTLEDRILDHSHEEKHWGFYAEVPLAQLLTDQQNLMQLHPAAKLQGAIENSGKNKLMNAVSYTDAVIDTAGTLAQGADGMMKKAGVDVETGNVTVNVGFKFSKKETKDQSLAGSGFNVGNLQINAEDFIWKNGASISADYAVFNVRNMVIRGAALSHSSSAFSYGVSGSFGSADYSFMGGQASVQDSSAKGSSYANAQGNFGHVHFENVQNLDAADFNSNANSASGDIANAHFATSLGYEKKHAIGFGVTSSLNVSYNETKGKGSTIAQQSGMNIGEGGSDQLHVGSLHLQGAAITNANQNKALTIDKLTSEDVKASYKETSIGITAPSFLDPALKANFSYSKDTVDSEAKATLSNNGTDHFLTSDGSRLVTGGINKDTSKAFTTDTSHEGLTFGISLKTAWNIINRPEGALPEVPQENEKLVKDSALLAELVYKLPKDGDSGMVVVQQQLEDRSMTIDENLSSKMGDGQAMVAKSEADKQIFVVFRGTQRRPADLISCALIAMTGDNLRQAEANALIKDAKLKYPGYEIVVTGHSLGGNVAENAAKSIEGIKVVSFNAPDGFSVLPSVASHRNAAKPFKSPVIGVVVSGDPISASSTDRLKDPNYQGIKLPMMPDSGLIDNHRMALLEQRLISK